MRPQKLDRFLSAGISGQTRVETDVSCDRVRLSTTGYIRFVVHTPHRNQKPGNRPRATPKKAASRPKMSECEYLD